jgi:oxygen-independent coproporphyrinogen III oxidase
MSGIYIHVPFCKQACSYCDFYFSTSFSKKEELVGSIVQELELRASYLENKELASIYFGGGTPSLLSQEEIEKLFSAVSTHFSIKPTCEITLEANPDDITKHSLKAWKEAGINRLSIGLQSFNNEELKWMNRAHTAEESLSSVKLAQDEGFNNITIDLIYGSKFQTPKSWEATLTKAIELNTQHISSYNLTIEHKTLLGVNHKKGNEPAVNDELSSTQFLMMSEALHAAGFIHYEISNFGKEGFFAKHNTNYWLQQHYLGLGPSAHSFNGSSRQWNVSNNNQYLKALKENTTFFEREELSVKERYNEYILTRLRTMWGCDVTEIKNLFGKEIVDHFNESVKAKVKFLQEEKGVYTLKPEARLLADGIASELFI